MGACRALKRYNEDNRGNGMRIEKVERLNLGRFRNFKWDSGLYSFSQEINIMFGWNGSGKTTFSKLFRAIEKNHIHDRCTFKVKTSSGHLTEINDLSGVGEQLRVFNDDFVRETLEGSKKIPYIFFAGKEEVDFSKDEEILGNKRRELSEVKLPSKHTEIATKTAELIRVITGMNSYVKELTGGSTYASYNRTDFERRIENIEKRINKGKLESHLELVRQGIDDLKFQLVDIQRITHIDKEIVDCAQWLLDNIEDINDLLSKEPIQEQSKRISELDEIEFSWVKEGIGLHLGSEQTLKKCLFCGSVITNAEELLNHFSEEVVQAINDIDEYSTNITGFTTHLAGLESLNESQNSSIDSLRSTFDLITPLLKEKRNHVPKKIAGHKLDKEKFQELTKITSPDAASVAYAIESHYVAEQYENYKTEYSNYESAFASKFSLQSEVEDLDEQVRILKQKAKDTHKPASALNRLFKVVFPHRAIEVTENPEGTGYVLKRDCEYCDFSTLSEGEKNFIALAYFVSSINDAQNRLPDDGVVVIDDPVSSLDKQAIFQIFAVIVNEVKKQPGRQYFLLTHNLDFLGHLKEQFRKKIAKKNGARLYNFAITDNGCIIERLHPLLRDHRSDYYYVFSVLYKFKNQCDIEDAHLVVNLLRRWLETFLEFKFSTSGDLLSTLETACKEAQKLTESWTTPFNANHLETYRFLNHGSHGFSDTESVDDSILINANQRIQEALQLVKILDPLHYKKLESTIT